MGRFQTGDRVRISSAAPKYARRNAPGTVTVVDPRQFAADHPYGVVFDDGLGPIFYGPNELDPVVALSFDPERDDLTGTGWIVSDDYFGLGGV